MVARKKRANLRQHYTTNLTKKANVHKECMRVTWYSSFAKPVVTGRKLYIKIGYKLTTYS